MEDTHEWRPRHNPWAVALTVTLATFMEVLDTSIANVSLPHIAGSLSATQDESTWVLTSYLVSNAIILPISAWLATTLGRKRFYMTCVAAIRLQQFPVRSRRLSLGVLIFIPRFCKEQAAESTDSRRASKRSWRIRFRPPRRKAWHSAVADGAVA